MPISCRTRAFPHFRARALPRLRGAVFLSLMLAAPRLCAQAGDTLELPLCRALELAGAGEEVGLAERRLDAAAAAVGSARAGGLPTVRLEVDFVNGK